MKNCYLDATDEWAAAQPDPSDRERFQRWLDSQPEIPDIVERSASRAAVASEQRAVSHWMEPEIQRDQRVAEQIALAVESEHRVMIEALGEVISHERHAMRTHVASEIASLRAEIAELKAIASGVVKPMPKRDAA